MNPFPDLHHLHRLRHDLWKTPGYGQAAVMVGSGLSLNAEPVPGERRKFPLWRDLAGGMFDKLYPGDADDGGRIQKRIQAIAGLGGIALASEYEAAFGRQALDEILLTSIPDDRYMPCELHRLLLELPWADVFTTNYDTLLERTIINERYYQLILTAEDLPGSTHPRIVKLHGSFPSQRPFIVTAEDYRTYPRRFAPFVNTVQQTLMENTLVLVGFSGDDPNFLYWSGWVRDELGPNAPRMYLCGVLNLTDPQKRLLEQRGVLPIDLSPIVADFPLLAGKSPHAIALEWLLLSLKKGQLPNSLRWPDSHRRSVPQPAYLPTLLSAAVPDLPECPRFLEANVAFKDRIGNVLEAWRSQRESYPGWLITPFKNREAIWEGTRHWLQLFLDRVCELDPAVRLGALFELNWRLERALVPLFLEWVKVFEEALTAIRPEQIQGSTNDPYLEESWVSLAFAVTREAREDFDAERHDRWLNRLLPIVGRRPDWQARWHYENCLHSLWRLDQRELCSRVEQWTTSPDLLVWQIRRASILAEIGDLMEAERIASETLRRIRTGLHGRQQNIELSSLEGWAMWLLGCIRRGYRSPRGQGVWDESEWDGFRDRWLQLASSRSDPWQEMEAIELALHTPSAPYIPHEEDKPDFDYGVTRTYHFAVDNLTPILPAFALLRLYEEAGLPMRAGMVTLASERVENACRWIMPFAPLWAAAMLLRASKNEPLRERFDRIPVATLDATEVETMRNWLVPAIRVAADFMPLQPTARAESLSEHVVAELADLLLRICMRFSPQQLDEVFRLALQLHTHRGVQSGVARHDVCRLLFRRIFDAASGEQIISWLPDLLALPTAAASDAKYANMGNHQWPDPFMELQDNMLKNSAGKLDHIDIAQRRIGELIHEVQHLDGVARDRAVYRLFVLSEARLLTSQQQSSFGIALWAHVSAETGLPSGSIFFAQAFLKLPAPSQEAARAAVRHRLLTRPTLRWVSETVQPNGAITRQTTEHGRKNPIVTDVLAATRPITGAPMSDNLIDWTVDEVSSLLKSAVEWWDADKVGLTASSAPNELLAAVKDLVPFFQKVVMPRLPRVAVADWEMTERVLKELEDYGIVIIGCLPAVLIAWPERAEEIANRIRAALEKGDEKGVAGALEAIRCWSLLMAAGPHRNMPPDLLDELCNRVRGRQQPALDAAIARALRVVRETPAAFSADQISSLCRGLGYLLEETRLPTRNERLAAPSGSVRIPLSERPRYRAFGACLAFELHKLLQSRNSPLPPVLEQWKQDCENDPLPEVRREWRV